MAKEELLDVFRFDEKYEENEQLWANIRNEILGDSDSEDEDEIEPDAENGGTTYEPPPPQEPVTHQVCL